MMFDALFSRVNSVEAATSPASSAHVCVRKALVALIAALMALALAGATGCTASAPESPRGEASDAALQRASVTVKVAVDSSAVEGSPVSFDASVTLDEGATAYDALQATGLSVNVTESSYGSYVSAIEGLAEGDHGDMSGWLYEVNDTEAQVAASSYVLGDGDAVRWYYSV